MMRRSILTACFIGVLILQFGCTTGDKMITVENVDLPRFMGKWYVLAGRFTYFEADVYNGLEVYTWNSDESRIDVDFTYNKGSFNGNKKSIPQKAWIENIETNAHWKVSPMWPLKFDYLVVELDSDYQWTAIGVPSQKYLWIMARSWSNPEKTIEAATMKLKAKGYNIDNIVRVPHEWPKL